MGGGDVTAYRMVMHGVWGRDAAPARQRRTRPCIHGSHPRGAIMGMGKQLGLRARAVQRHGHGHTERAPTCRLHCARHKPLHALCDRPQADTPPPCPVPRPTLFPTVVLAIPLDHALVTTPPCSAPPAWSGPQTSAPS